MTDDRPTGEHWLTYAEAAECLGLTTEAVRALARRRKWDRRSPNAIGGQAWVLIPADRLANKRPMVAANGQIESTNGHSKSDQRSDVPLGHHRSRLANGHGESHQRALPVANDRRVEDIVTVVRELTEPLKDQITDLKGQLATERERADCAEEQAREAEGHVRELQGRLETAEARIADKDAMITDIRHRLDQADTDRRQALDRLAAAQERIAALLTDQRTAPPTPAAPEPAPRRSWLPWRRR